MGQMIMSIAILAFGVLIFANSFGFPQLQNGALPDAGVWPRAIAVLLIIFAALALLSDIREIQAKKNDPNAKSEKDKSGYDPNGRKRMIGTVVILGLYCIPGLRYLGFIADTLIGIPVLMLWLGERKWLRIVLVSLIMTAICVAAFCKFMLIPLPRGMGIFRNFSLLFY